MDSQLQLSEDGIVKTVAALHNRINDRFPGSGLAELCRQLLSVAEKSAVRSRGIGQSVWWIRICGYTLALLIIALLVAMIWMLSHSVRFKNESLGWTDLISAFDAGTSGLIVLGATIYFLTSLEARIKRRRALAAVHELRSLAHVVDMHQLTKDPERMLRRYRQTSHSPSEAMTPLQLSRYLDYCTEMLSLIGKIAALYVQRFDDSSAVAAVSEVEQLTTGLSRKIWQKIMLLNQIADTVEGIDPHSRSGALPVPKVGISPGGAASELPPHKPARAPADPESA